MAERAGNFSHAGQARASAADQHAEPHESARVEARVSRRRIGEPGDAKLKAEKAAIQKHVAERDGGKRDDKSGVEPRAFDQHRIERGIGELLRLRKIEAFRIAPGPVHEP